MHIVEWSESLLTGVLQSDLQHRHLIDLLNEIHSDNLGETEIASLKSSVDELVKSITSHLINESCWSVSNNSDLYFEYKHDLDRFKKNIVSIRDGWCDHDTNTYGMFVYLKYWLINHIVVTHAHGASDFTRYS